MAPLIVMGAWSMAFLLGEYVEYYYYLSPSFVDTHCIYILYSELRFIVVVYQLLVFMPCYWNFVMYICQLSLTHGTHAQEGYGTCLVCTCVCVCMCGGGGGVVCLFQCQHRSFIHPKR